MKKSILLTGARGALGLELLELQTAETHFIPTSKESADTLFVDVTQPDSISNALKTHQPDAIIHLAAMVPIPQVEQQTDIAFQININGLQNLLTAVEKIKPDTKVIVASSSEVYGSNSEKRKFTESDPFNPNNLYAFTKVCQEHLSQLYKKRNLDIKIARVFNYSSKYKKPIYSLESFANQVATMIKEGKVNQIKVGNLLPERDFLQGYDVATALLKIALINTDEVVFNIARGEYRSMQNYLDLIIKEFGYPIEVIRDESKFRMIDSMFVCGDNTKLKGLGWKPKYSAEEMIGALVSHYKQLMNL